MEPNHKRITLLGLPIDRLRFADAVEKIMALSRDGHHHYVVTLNPEMVVEAGHNKPFRTVIEQADLVVPDGTGIMVAADALDSAARFHVGKYILAILCTLSHQESTHVLPDRVTGTDLVPALCQHASRNNAVVAFVGGSGDDAARAALAMVKRYPGLQSVTDPGPVVAMAETEAERTRIIAKLNQEQAAIIFVGFGHAKQELWIAQHLNVLPVSVAIGVGGAFAYLAGTKQRAHPLVQKTGLEWLWRLLTEPKRWKRIYNATICFSWLLVRNSR